MSGRVPPSSLAAVVLLLVAGPAQAGWWDGLAEPRPTTAGELRDRPDRWKDVPVLLQVQFETRPGPASTTPARILTGFAAERWSVLVAAPVRGDPLPLPLAVRRGTADQVRAISLVPPDVAHVCAVVREVVAGEPWLEVLDVRGPADPLGPVEQDRVALGDRFLRLGSPEAALRVYRQVLDGRLPAPADRLALLRRVGQAALAAGLGTAARDAFTEVLTLDPADGPALVALRRLSRGGVPMPGDGIPAGRRPPRDDEKPTAPATPRPGLAPPRGLDGRPVRESGEDPEEAPGDGKPEDEEEAEEVPAEKPDPPAPQPPRPPAPAPPPRPGLAEPR